MTVSKHSSEAILKRNNVHIIGHGSRPLVLAHGFGCDQKMWRFLTPLLESDYRIILFDYTGSGKSDVSNYDKARYSKLQGYAEDVIEICDALAVSDVVFVGHSVSSIIGILAANNRPDLFAQLVLVCPSPSFMNFEPEYRGGFEREDLEELLSLMDKNYIGWANYLAPLVIGTQPNEEFTKELSDSFCSTDPNYLKPFARATFLSDHRADLSKTKHRTLILQSERDTLASVEVGHYMATQIPSSKIDVIDATGHCLHMTDPNSVYDSMSRFIAETEVK